MIFRIMMKEHEGSFESYNHIRREKGKGLKISGSPKDVLYVFFFRHSS